MKIKSDKTENIDSNYIKYPREIINMKSLDAKRMAVFSYLSKYRTLSDNVNLSLNDLIAKSGYKANRNTGKVNDQIVTVLNALKSLGYFTLTQGDFFGDKLCTLYLNIEKFDVGKEYCCISLRELDLMSRHKSNRNNTSFSNLILTLAYIRVNKLRRSNHQRASPKTKPEFFYRQIKTFASDVGLSERIVSNCIRTLNDLDIIVSCPMLRYKDISSQWHTDVTLFVDKTSGWENELEWGKAFLLQNRSLHYKDSQLQHTQT